MANTYYDSQLTAEQIEQALEAIIGVIVQANNGKVLAINNGKLEARSVQWGGGEPVLEPLSVIANGDYTPEVGVDGFDEVHVAVPSSSPTIQSLSVNQNGTYTAPSGVDGYSPVVVNVSGGGGGSSSVETASVFRWMYQGPTTCWGIMKKLSGDVIGQNGDNANANISLVGDLMTVTFHGTSQSVEVLATTAIKLREYRTSRTLGPATMTEYTMAANDQQSFSQDNVYGGIYFEAEAV